MSKLCKEKLKSWAHLQDWKRRRFKLKSPIIKILFPSCDEFFKQDIKIFLKSFRRAMLSIYHSISIYICIFGKCSSKKSA